MGGFLLASLYTNPKQISLNKKQGRPSKWAVLCGFPFTPTNSGLPPTQPKAKPTITHHSPRLHPPPPFSPPPPPRPPASSMALAISASLASTASDSFSSTKLSKEPRALGAPKAEGRSRPHRRRCSSCSTAELVGFAKSLPAWSLAFCLAGSP